MSNVTTVPLLMDLQGPWASLQLELIGPGSSGKGLTLPDIYPFQSVTELKRRLWLHHNGDPRWAPERVFVGVRDATDPTQLRPLEFYWPTAAEPTLVDPTVAARTPSPLLVDDAGNRKPIQPTMVGNLLLEIALEPTVTVTAINLAALIGDLTPEQLTPALFGGFYQLYFPWLTAPAQVLDAASTTPTKSQKDSFAITVPYLEDRTGRVSIVQRALGKGVGGPAVSMMTMVRLRWVLPTPASRPESLEKTFYGLKASPTIPFLRYFPAEGSGSPLLKLALYPDGSPVISNPKVLNAFLSRPAPNLRTGVIVARVPLTSVRTEATAAFTLHMFEDGTADITFEVPYRGLTYTAAVATEAQRLLREVMTALGYPPTAEPLLRDLFATYKWAHPTPQTAAPITATRLRNRVAALTPFLDSIPIAADETAIAAFQWKAISNYEAESAQFAYVTQMVLRVEKEGLPSQDPAAAHAAYVEELSGKFGLTPDQANTLLERWMERRGEAVAPAPGQAAGVKAVPVHAAGTRIAISGTHPEYSIEIYGASSYMELQRIVSVVGVLLGATTADLTLAPPTQAVSLLTEAVAVQDKAVSAAVATVGGGAAGEPLAPEATAEDMAVFEDMMDLMGFDVIGDMAGDVAEAEALAVGTGTMGVPETKEDDATPSVTAAAPAPAPNVTAASMPGGEHGTAMAAVEEECRGNPWSASDPPLKIKPDWYMARLKKEDVVMFGFGASATGRIKSYSKSCQRQDDRQPNIMTLAEYSRVRRCYEDRVRFVDLPPRKPEDLPRDPAYNPKKRYPDSYFLTDPETKRPMWTVYNYENKTTPGQYLYLMCAELWCERDNLPLLPSEFAGTEGRGFSKPPNTCPFCAGSTIRVLEAPKTGESVIVRHAKSATGKLHAFIGTITRNKHPNGYPLPCCATTPRMLKLYLNAAATKTLVMGRDLAALDDGEEEGGKPVAGGAAGGAGEEPEPEIEPGSVIDADKLEVASVITGVTTGTTGPPAAGEETPTDYRRLFATMRSQYILGADKVLTAGKFGLLSPALDRFFGQNGPAAIESRGVRPTFKEDVTLFIRLGVDNRIRAPGLNLFAALAPLLGFDSAEQTQRAFLALRAARAFESANYGTLLHEFAVRPTPPSGRFEKTLPEFAAEFGYPLDTARPHVLRLYRAWTAWLAYMADIYEPKELRYIEHMLAQPGVVTPRGLLLIVLEQEDPKSNKIRVVCPSFGIPPASVFGEVPVAFLWHDRRDNTWEPLLLYNDATGAAKIIYLFGERSMDLEAVPAEMRGQLASWIREWRSSSRGCGRGVPPPHVWTPGKDATGLPRLRDLLLGGDVKALVRDRSNRLVGVLAPHYVPCLDDGSLAVDTPRVYEATMIPPTALTEMLAFYTALSARFPPLKPAALVANLKDTATVIGFRTAAGTLVPIAPEPFNKSATTSPLPIQQIDAFPWEFDGLLLRAPDAPPTAAIAMEESAASVEEQLEEAYQHLRLGFSRFLLREAQGLALRQEIQRILDLKQKATPLYELRKRMDILLEPQIRQMVAVDATTERKALSLLRQDCLSPTMTEAACKGSAAGSCSWSGGRCLIHAPTPAESVDPVRIFTARLSDELLRYAVKQREIFNNAVPEIRTPRGVVRVGNELYTATRAKEGAASIMERLGFTGEQEMRFPEEMLRFDGLEEESEELAAVTAARGVPVIPDYSDTKLPSSWTTTGITLPDPSSALPDPREAVFLGVTDRSREVWEKFIQRNREPPDMTTPLNWSPADFYALAKGMNLNILFIRDGRIRTWIRSPKEKKMGTIIFWGPKELLIHRGKQWIFNDKELPPSVGAAMDLATPMERDAILPTPVIVTGGGASWKKE